MCAVHQKSKNKSVGLHAHPCLQPAPPLAAVAAALGLRLPGLGAACALPLALTALLLAGPLLPLALSWWGADAVQQDGSGSGGGSASTACRRPGPLWRHRVSALPAAVRVRNWLAAPLLEEFLFRGCLLSFLLSSGVRPAPAIALSPLLFAACHLHHWRELVHFQGCAPRAAVSILAFQLGYTTLFGWLAAFLFVRSRHLAAAVLPHALCNVVGPPGPPRARSAAGTLVVAALPVGTAAFFAALGPLTRPELFDNDLLGAWGM